MQRRRAHAMLAGKAKPQAYRPGLTRDGTNRNFVKFRHPHQIFISHLAEKIQHLHSLIWGDNRNVYRAAIAIIHCWRQIAA